MTTAGPYTFRKVTHADLALLNAWRAAPHVLEWWGAGCYGPDDLAEPRVARWIVSLAGRSFAFMQDYAVHGWDNHHFAHLPKGSRGIDQFIGEGERLGQGHGTAMIGQHMAALFRGGAPVIATDPHPDNARAIAVYGKLGFAPAGPPQQTQWGLVLPMLARR